MSTDWLLQPLSIKSIASKYTLPVVIQPALGFRGSNQCILLHSITNITFAYGRALKEQRVKTNGYQSFRPIDSEIVAIPLKYPGYFECLLPSSHGGTDDHIIPQTSIRTIVEQIQYDLRSRAFYIVSPLRVYFLEKNSNGQQYRLWKNLEAHQIIIFEKLVDVEYTPTENDNLTDDDYEYWLFCFSRRILNRHERVIKCILTNKAICFIPSTFMDDVCLFPVGQSGSTDFYKLQTIENLINNFSLPINIKLARFPGAETYKDFNGYVQLLNSHMDEFAICASLSTVNVSMIPVKTSMKFLVIPIQLITKDINIQLERCQMFLQSFDNQIRRIFIPSQLNTPHRLNLKRQSTSDEKRSSKFDDINLKSDNSTTTTRIDSRIDSLINKRRAVYGRQRAISTNIDNINPRPVFRRTLSHDSNNIYNTLIHPVRSTSIIKQMTTSTSPTISKKSTNHSQSSLPFTYDTGINLATNIGLPDVDGAILLENTAFLTSIKPNNRL